ncbi:glycosyl transferase family protein [Streptococcus mitis]|uniref:Glycosyl transferase family protein n=1 Tax=Streptococcus mitis TaxID=28037 RepID=A0A0F2DER2_STRMT|nr:glycosyltransferase family 2 protein [Streptococcus mitis]KJQ68460.1 glycosyl transferase family protein [Streptococcus mitis]
MISVIVPVYNVETYLEECLDSIQNQTYTDFEVLLVNDGSTDRSKAICERYCKENRRFHLLNQENQGLSAARNTGVAASRGEFIAFVDSDDMILANYLETLIHYMREDVDIVESQFTVSNEEFLAKSFKEPSILFEGNSQEAVKIFPKHVLNVNAVTKLYRRSIVEAVPYIDGVIFEDVYCGIGMLKYIRKIIKIDYKGYYYRQHQASIMHRTFTPKNLDIFTVSDQLIDLYSDREELLPYIGSFLVHLATMHYQDYIQKGNPYAKVYNQKLAEYVAITKKNPEVAKSSRMIRLYNLCPRYYNTILFPFYHSIWKWKNGIREDKLEE